MQGFLPCFRIKLTSVVLARSSSAARSQAMTSQYLSLQRAALPSRANGPIIGVIDSSAGQGGGLSGELPELRSSRLKGS